MIASLACLKSSIKLDPNQSMLKLSKKRNATHRAVSRAVNKDPSAEILRQKTLQLAHCPLQSDQGQKLPKISQSFQVRGKIRLHFCLRKKIIVDNVANRKNPRIIACKPSNVSLVMQSKNRASVMIFAAVSCGDKVMPLHLIQTGLKINMEGVLEDPHCCSSTLVS